MRNCFSRFLSWGIIALFVSLTAATSCTQVDDTLGSGLIPDGQRTKTGVDTIGLGAGEAVKAYYSFTDTINSHNQTLSAIGRSNSDIFGKTAAATLVQYLPTLIRTDTTAMGFGYGAAVDSVRLLIAMNYMSGDKEVEQTFNIFALKDTLRTDTTYYVNFPYEEYIGPEPVFTFTYKGESPNADPERIKTDVTPAGEELLEELLSDASLYDRTKEAVPLFRKRFPGLVIAPADGSPDNGALYYSNLPYTVLELYFHNYTDASLTTIKDKGVRQTFSFDDTTINDTIPRSHSVISVRHDYTGTIMDGVKEGPIEAAIGYVQGVAGVTTTLEFPDAFFDAIDALKEDPSDDLMIHQAMMYVYLEDDSVEAMDNSHLRLGSYMKYSTLTPIADYHYMQESSTSAVPLAYDGRLNRTYGYYAMDITSYLHQAWKKESVERKFTLAPLAYPYVPNDALTYKETALTISDTAEGKNNKQIRVKLTYTLIK